MPTSRRYWDSNAFLAFLKKESGRVESCYGVIESAEKGDLEIVTSALTVAEVLYLKGNPKIPREKSEEIRKFFEQEYILLMSVDRFIAEEARNLVWDYNVRPKDAIHVASAIRAKVPILDTFDEDLISLSGKVGNPPLIVGKPNIPYQRVIPYEGNDVKQITDKA